MATTNHHDAEAGIATKSKLSKILSIAHLLVMFGVFIVAISVYVRYGSLTAIGFVLSALSLLITSYGAIEQSDRAKKSTTVVSLVVAIAGAAMFYYAFEQAASDGPGVNTVTFSFSAKDFDVQQASASNQPCVPQSATSAPNYTCYLKVQPLTQPVVPAQQ